MRTARYGKTLTIAAVLVGALTAGALLAQTSSNPSYPQSTTPTSSDSSRTMSTPMGSNATASMRSVDGKVISTSASSLVVETDAGKRLTFNLDSATAQPASLAAGDRVTVRYSALSGSNHADNIVLAAASTNTVADATSSAMATSEPATAPSTTETSASAANLPKTASPLPLVLLVGVLAALVAFGVHLSRERV